MNAATRTKLTKTERKVLVAVAEGQRGFHGHREIMACRKLADRGWLTMKVESGEGERLKVYDFGRNYHSVRFVWSAAHITDATKIERAVAEVGRVSFIASVAKAA